MKNCVRKFKQTSEKVSRYRLTSVADIHEMIFNKNKIKSYKLYHFPCR